MKIQSFEIMEEKENGKSEKNTLPRNYVQGYERKAKEAPQSRAEKSGKGKERGEKEMKPREIAEQAAAFAAKGISFTADEKVKAIAAAAAYIDSLESGKTYVLTIKERKKRRSLDANAYAWALLDKLAARLGIPKTDIYRGYIKEIGGNSELVCVKSEAVESLREGWEHNGLGWQTDTLPSKLPNCTNVILYYGSSEYDSAQMSRLIDLIVQDCKQIGIETMTPKELEQLVGKWGQT